MIAPTAADLLARMDAATPADADDLRALDTERGWVEAIRHLGQRGLLNAAGEAEAAKILAASGEWLDGFGADVVLPPVPADEPVVVSGSS